MNTQLVIGIVVAVVVLIALIVVGIVLSRRRRISLTDSTAQKPVDGTTPQVDKSGGYKAGSGFSFSQGGAGGVGLAEPPEPVVRPGTAHPAPERTEVDGQPGVGDDASVPRDSAQRGIKDVALPDTEPDTDTDTDTPAVTDTSAPEAPTAEPTTEPAPTEPAPTGPATAEPVEAPEIPDTAAELVDAGRDTVTQPEPAATESAPNAAPREEIAPTAGRLNRLRGRLSRSQGAIGKSVLGLLGAGDLDEESWEEIEDTLLMADLGTASTMAVVERLRSELATSNVRTADEARALLRSVLIAQVRPELDRSVRALPHAGGPSVILVVGVNGTGKTTTTGKLARVLAADGRRVLLGAADTFRAAAADQLQTWGERVGADIVRGKEQADPASVAFDAVSKGIDTGVDVVMIDTAGRLHTKTGLMDELGKVKRVVEKKAAVDEVLLVLDATVGQNGLTQARVFAEVVDITGVVLTKLDGTAKGGIVFHVQEELGVPVKLVGLGEGADDLAPFEPEAFVDALL
ncbi:signal recognition particle-docking protein FtsY [Gordonia sp. ABSL11-1]|uniref:signal recognition particle-docking protein FtsY n=1 Tax=Gordonia sp. ABSL11-1 TaxID=3053924 RepID=UPI00257416D5|nr:signal recognition particle-docking protein FtsY [Gordonia sp. ABSL11-1]MDL9944713.1 signal recognition particle-docking protein FtsY [Gordonia sp. ABSL11-1]